MTEIGTEERCPTCDQIRAQLDDYAAWRACDGGATCLCPLDRCWAPMHSACTGERVDWRARALTAEAEVLRLNSKENPNV